jgi:2-C-methyl-D-erythritol 4-phosphate cytidylyltransferase
MKKYAVIVAAGSGSRMGGDLPKQFLIINEKPVLYYTLQTFLNSYNDMQVILVLPVDYTDMGQEIIDAWFDKDRIRITAGGDTRFQSVKNGLQMVDGDAIIFVHDGVRCLLTEQLIHKCYESAVDTGTAIPVVTSKDSVRFLHDSGSEAVDRNKVMLVQTPQTFHSKILVPAFQIDYKEKFTDEATVAEAFGIKVILVDGEENNIKITRPIDLVVAAKILDERNNQVNR